MEKSDNWWKAKQWSSSDVHPGEWAKWKPGCNNWEGPTLWELASINDAEGLKNALRWTGRWGVNSTNRRGWTPLQVAAIENSAEAALACIQHGANIGGKTGYLSPTALHLAAWHGHIATAQVLLRNSADVTALNGLGELPVEKAKQRGHKELQALLIQFNSPPPVDDLVVANSHALTARVVASARAAESERHDGLFFDPLAHRLAGKEGLSAGDQYSWMLTPRTVYGDQVLLHARETNATKQVVLLGAGMDSRAFRMGSQDLTFFEVDQDALFDVKEPLLCGIPSQCSSRHTISLDLCSPNITENLAKALRAKGFEASSPSCWLLEGLIMYLAPHNVEKMLQAMNALTAPGSCVFHDAVSVASQRQGIQCCGARFESGNDDYAGLWKSHGFDNVRVIDFNSIYIDRQTRSLNFHPNSSVALADVCGRNVTFFVEAHKSGASCGDWKVSSFVEHPIVLYR